MKIYFKGPVEFYIQRKPREPMSLEKFYALVWLLGVVAVVSLIVAAIIMR